MYRVVLSIVASSRYLADTFWTTLYIESLQSIWARDIDGNDVVKLSTKRKLRNIAEVELGITCIFFHSRQGLASPTD